MLKMNNWVTIFIVLSIAADSSWSKYIGPGVNVPNYNYYYDDCGCDYETYWDYLMYPMCCEEQPTVPPPTTTTTKRTTTKTPKPPKCPYRIPGWARIDGREYYLGTSNQTTWYEAEAMALEQGAVLLEVDSYQKSKIFDKIVDCYPRGTHLWIGGNDLARSGHWTWSRGRPVEGYLNWSNDLEGDCMEVILPQNKWHATECIKSDSKHGFVAEIYKKPTLKPSASTSKPSISTNKPPYSTTKSTSTARPPISTTTQDMGQRPTRVRRLSSK